MKTLVRFRSATLCILFAGLLLACSSDTNTEVRPAGEAPPQTETFEILNAFSAVGSSSKTAQIIAPKLEEYLGQPVELHFSQGREAGLGGPTDGNTIVMSTIGLMALLPAVLADYVLDPLADLRPITRTTQTPDILVVRSDLGINNIQELVEYSNQNPGELTYFHIAPTSIHRLEWAAFFGELGIEARLDESRSNGNDDAMGGIIDGSLDMMISTSPYMTSLIETGDGVPLAVINPTRMPLFPDIPTLLELGSETMSAGSWAAVFAPAGTSEADIDRIFTAMQFAMADPEVVAEISAIGMEIDLSDSPAEFSEFLESEMLRLSTAAMEYNFRTD
jgi:tripartite-type tricarboxylate transporter receptor subunit TctC